MSGRAALGILALAVLAAGGATTWYWWSHRPAAPTATTAAPYTRRFDRQPRRVPGTILVNDSPDATLGAGVPIYVQVALRNPTDTALALAAPPSPGPSSRSPGPSGPGTDLRVRHTDGTAVAPVTFSRIGDWPVNIPPRSETFVSWTLAGTLGAGEYEVSADGAASWLADGGLRLDLAPARVVVSAEASPDQSEAAAIRVLILQSRAQDALARLDAALARPDAPMLWHMWRADTLETLNRDAEARDSLVRLGALITARQRQARQPVELPFWLAERLAAGR
jgi:hypothetical protein